MATLGGCDAYCLQKRKGKEEVGWRWKEVGTRARGSDVFVEKNRGPIMELACSLLFGGRLLQVSKNR